MRSMFNYLIFISFSDGTCRTMSHGKPELIVNHYAYRDPLGYLHVLNVTAENRPKYSELGPGIPGKPCVFPFQINGTEFNVCTSYQSPFGWPRCATKESQDLDRDGSKSSWGFCSQECPVEASGLTPTSDDLNENTLMVFNDGEVYIDRLSIEYTNGTAFLWPLADEDSTDADQDSHYDYEDNEDPEQGS